MAPDRPFALGAAAIDPAEELVGQTLGNFRIVRRLGSGGMGVVYLGKHTVIGSKVAVKVLHRHLSGDPTLVGRFLAEARAVNRIGHENIVSIFDLSQLAPDRTYLVMEYLEGQPLASMIGKPVPEATAVPILTQICRALHAAHQAGVVHRDLKPDNVFLVRRRRTEHFVKIVDFGIAKLLDGAAGLTAAGMVVGTPEYMAPEQWAGGPVDGRLDLYAAGLVGYAMLTAHLPFGGKTPIEIYRGHRDLAPMPPRQLNPEVSEPLERALLKALAKNPADRFQDALEFAAALEEVLAGAERRPATQVRLAPAPAPRDCVYPARVRWGAQSVAARVQELSRGGLFVCTEGAMPPLLETAHVAIEHPGGVLECTGEVVRQVPPELARAWSMPAGFALQVAHAPLGVRDALGRLGRGEAPDAARAAEADDPEAAAVLESWAARAAGDPYRVLGVPPDVECSEIRHRGRQAAARLEALAPRPLTPAQRARIDELLEQIHAAMTILGTPGWRADHDAARGNFRGVARALAAGLSVAELEARRQVFARTRAAEVARASVDQLAPKHLAREGRSADALERLEAALRLDPLNLALHQRYWPLKGAAPRQ